MQTVNRATIEDALIETQDEAGEDSIKLRDQYSGRGMYGNSCFGVTAESFPLVTTFLINLAALDSELARQLSKSMRTDGMGLGIIAYFPGYELAGGAGDEQDEDES